MKYFSIFDKPGRFLSKNSPRIPYMAKIYPSDVPLFKVSTLEALKWFRTPASQL
ncbi:MAG: hypothetical protein MJZ16_09815 [Bacteroidales bacterium]|nr:hypothetical protein [Bacteroidales bacterium]